MAVLSPAPWSSLGAGIQGNPARGQALELLLGLNERLREPPQSIRELGRIWKHWASASIKDLVLDAGKTHALSKCATNSVYLCAL